MIKLYRAVMSQKHTVSPPVLSEDNGIEFYCTKVLCLHTCMANDLAPLGWAIELPKHGIGIFKLPNELVLAGAILANPVITHVDQGPLSLSLSIASGHRPLNIIPGALLATLYVTSRMHKLGKLWIEGVDDGE